VELPWTPDGWPLS